MTTLYIAGPMTGIDDHNFPAFFAAEAALRDAGHDPANPANNGQGDDGLTWVDYMRRDIADLLKCSGVAVLPGWEASRGARLEVQIATALDMPVRPVSEWLEAAA